MRRFLSRQGSTDRFWSIRRAGAQVTVHFGPVGRAGQARSRKLADDDSALGHVERAILTKLRKGYEEQLEFPPIPCRDARAFKQRFGATQKASAASAALASCHVPDRPEQSLFPGALWTTGYHRPDEDPKTNADWTALAHATAVAWAVHEVIDSQQVFPFVLGHPISGTSFRSEFCDAAGLRAPHQDLLLHPARGDSVFHDPQDLGFDTTQQNAVTTKASQVLQNSLSQVKEVRFPQRYNQAPVFWLGHTESGYLAGVFAIRGAH